MVQARGFPAECRAFIYSRVLLCHTFVKFFFSFPAFSAPAIRIQKTPAKAAASRHVVVKRPPITDFMKVSYVFTVIPLGAPAKNIAPSGILGMARVRCPDLPARERIEILPAVSSNVPPSPSKKAGGDLGLRPQNKESGWFYPLSLFLMPTRPRRPGARSSSVGGTGTGL